MTKVEGLVIEVQDFAPQPEDLILDASSAAQYHQGHVPGAVHLNLAWLMCGTAPYPHKAPSLAQLGQRLAALGLAPERRVWLLDDEGGGWAGRTLWSLHLLGHRNVHYLNGGMRAWLAAGLPTERAANLPQANPVPPSWSHRPEVAIDCQTLLAELHQVQIWDARSLAEYQGQARYAAEAGHIPGAQHLDWLDLMDPARHYRLRSDCAARLEEAGLNLGAPTVTHCHAHHRSGLSYLVGAALGMNIRAYDGGWAEWGNRPDTPKSLSH